MSYNMFSFTNPAQQDPSAQAGMQQYIQQGQAALNPGQTQVAASSPIAAAAHAALGNALQQPQQPLAAQTPSSGSQAPMGNLPIAPGQYQSPQALDNATGQLYPSQYAAQQSQPWLQRMASALMSNPSSDD